MNEDEEFEVDSSTLIVGTSDVLLIRKWDHSLDGCFWDAITLTEIIKTLPSIIEQDKENPLPVTTSKEK